MPRNTEASKRTAASGRNIEKVSGSRVHGDCKRCGAGIFTGRIVGGFWKGRDICFAVKRHFDEKVLSGYKYADDGGSGYFVWDGKRKRSGSGSDGSRILLRSQG